MSKRSERPFFIGFLAVPTGLRLFLATIACGLVGGFAALSFATGTSVDDPGDAAFRFDWGRQTVTGVLELQPYPIIHVTSGSKRIRNGLTIMLAGQGKRGVQRRAAPLDGQLVQARGIIIKRGDLLTMQLAGGKRGLQAAPEGTVTPAIARENLGRWRLAGEMCDGKCLSGAMRPGRGLAHKACANLCLIGGAAPVFVSTAPIAGSEFLLMAGDGGGPLPAQMLDQTARLIELEGRIERRGSMLVFLIEPGSIKLL